MKSALPMKFIQVFIWAWSKFYQELIGLYIGIILMILKHIFEYCWELFFLSRLQFRNPINAKAMSFISRYLCYILNYNLHSKIKCEYQPDYYFVGTNLITENFIRIISVITTRLCSYFYAQPTGTKSKYLESIKIKYLILINTNHLLSFTER